MVRTTRGGVAKCVEEVRARLQGHGSAHLDRGLTGACRRIDHCDACSERSADHDGCQAHPAGAVHHDLLACGAAPDGGHRPVRRSDATAKGRGYVERDLVWQLDEIDVGGGEGDVLGEAAPSVEAGLPLLRAHLVIARLADEALSASAHEGHGYPVTDAPSRDVRANGSDRSRELVAGDMRKLRHVVVTVPGMPVAAAEAG